MATNDEAKLASVQAATGTARGWNGDWIALFDAAGIAAGDFNGRMLAWINAQLGTSYTSLVTAQNALAVNQGAASWGQLGAFSTSLKLLDSLTAAPAVAYSTRKLRSDYAGSALKVRRSSDNATQDIGFTASGDLDTAAMLSFVGANNGFVDTLYDQSGNGVNLTQGTLASQPKIVATGSTFTFGTSGKAGLDISGNTGVNSATGFNVTGDSNFSCAVVWGGSTAVGGTTKVAVMAGTNAVGQGWGVGQAAATTDRCFIWSGIDADVTSPSPAVRQNMAVRTGNSIAHAVNGGSPATTSGAGTLNVTSRLDFGKVSQFNFHSPDACAELIIWASAIGSTDQSTVYTSQKTYWGTP